MQDKRRSQLCDLIKVIIANNLKIDLSVVSEDSWILMPPLDPSFKQMRAVWQGIAIALELDLVEESMSPFIGFRQVRDVVDHIDRKLQQVAYAA